jgi:hypothetical protein
MGHLSEDRMRHHLCIYHHLGMGDHIICGPIVRERAAHYDLVVVLAKYHNVPSVTHLFADLPNVAVRAVVDDEEANNFTNVVWKGEVMRLGYHGGAFKGAIFDQEFYRQAKLSFDLRWSGWKIKRNPDEELAVEKLMLEQCAGEMGAFVHEDKARGMAIDYEKHVDSFFMWTGIAEPVRRGTPNIFGYIGVIQKAEQIHCINSSFALLIDSIDLPRNPKLFLHEYARPGGEIPTFRKEWTRLK